MRSISKAPSPRRKPSSAIEMVASASGPMRPSTEHSRSDIRGSLIDARRRPGAEGLLRERVPAEGLHSQQAMIAELDHPAHLLVQFDAAAAAAQPRAAQHEHPVTLLVEILRIELPELEAVLHRGDPLPVSVVAAISVLAGEHAARHPELHLGVDLGEQRLALPGVPALEGAPHPRDVAAQAAGFSTMVATPCPTPMHIVARPKRAPRRRIPHSSGVKRRAPEQPSGWPSAIAPPLTFNRSWSIPSSRMHAI